MATESSTTKAVEEKPWYADLPAPRSIPGSITRENLLSWLEEGKVAGKDFVLVDVRRTDFEGGTVRGAINLPAQSLYGTIPTLYTLFSTAGVSTVIWYCSSSRGRGTRTAGWFADYIKEQNDTTMESIILKEGIKGWATGGDEYVKKMDGYIATYWQQQQ